MPTTTNPTTAEIASLERGIAEGVMGWTIYPNGDIKEKSNQFFAYYLGGLASSHPQEDEKWSPWNNAADALAVLERLAMLNPPEIILPWYRIERNGPTFTVSILHIPGTEATAPGPHYGPAVCLLAEKVMEGR